MTEVVRVVFTKWGGHPHWEFDTTLLGEDRIGVWLAVPAGTPMSRPGLDVVTDYPAVVVVPNGEPWVAMLMSRAGTADDPNPPVVYVDVTTVPSYDGATVRAVDLDLDVLRLLDGTVVVDDEDEFEEHRVSYGYPKDVIELAMASCAGLVEDLSARSGAFGSAGADWLQQVGSD